RREGFEALGAWSFPHAFKARTASSPRDSHLRQCRANGAQQRVHVGRINPADMPDPEAIGIAHFARIDDLTELIKTFIKFLKVELGMHWITEGSDDVAPIFRAQIGLESHRLHPGE